ncbi:MAG: non-ribosomal peptide synthase/polyketide synthase, partial [Pseudomonadota bacterium]
MKEAGIRLRLADGKLLLDAPAGAITDAIRAAVREHKPALMAYLASLQSTDAPIPAVPALRGSAVPLSFAQQRLWFIDQLEPGNASYNLPAGVRLLGRLDTDALARTLDEVVRRHEVLRTSFRTVDGSPVQAIAERLTLGLPLVDLAGLPEEEREARMRRAVREEALAPFDLATGPLLRAKLLRLGAQEHVVLLTMHHIVSDGWSTGVLVREIAALYAAFARGEPSPLPELPIQYADFAHWQRQRLSGDALQRQLAYWRGQLAGAPEVLALPTDRPRPPAQRYRGATHRFTVPADVTRGLHAVGQREQATLFMTLAAAFNLLLARYSGQDDVCIGTPIANRQRSELEPLIGFFVNTLVLRTRVDAAASFTDLLRQVRATALGAYAHQDLPFEQLVDAVAPARSMAHQPLFQVMLVLQNAPMERLSLPDLELRPLAAAGDSTKFDLSLSVVEGGPQLFATLEYDTDLFDAASIERLVGHFGRLLQSVTRQPEVPMHRLDWLAEEELVQLRAWNATDAEYPREQVLHGLFEAQVERTPDAVALAFEGTELTYAALNARANRLAHHLREVGVGPDVLVAVCAERSLQMVVALMAVLKAGGAYVPLDPGYPSERLAFMLADAKPAVLLTQEALLASLPAHEVPTFCLDSQWDSLPLRDGNPPSTTLPAHLAYVIYTSGSTGRPKAAGVSHTAIVNRLHWMQQAYGLDSSDRVLQKTPFSFDVSVWEFFWPLQQGATLVMARPGGHQDAQYLGELIASAGITTLHFVPPMLEAFLAASRALLPALRQVMCSGQALPWELQQRFFERLPQVQLHNLYGPTEAAVDVTAWHCTPKGPQGVVPIGRPISNIRIHIVDAQFNLLPQGVPGELCIAGVGLARGYIGRAELTAERFMPDPFGQPGERMYRTGDLARWLPDGSIEYLGRIDQQVKIRGFRIELGEIEAQLAAQAGVREAVVLAREDVPGDTRLVAYVVPEGIEQLETTALRTQLQRQLPEYMVPAHFVVLEALPLSPNGKLDRKALPAPDTSRGETGYVAPRTPTEATLASIWADVLKVDRVGVQDNFFALGGHSLLATQLVSRMRTALDVELPLRTLFEAPTVAQLAGRVQAAQQAALPAIERVPRTGEALPLSFAQQRLWFIDRLEPGSSFYNIPAAVRLVGQLDVQALDRTLNEVVRRHEVLRTAFLTVEGSPVQVIAPQLRLALPLADLRGLPEGEREAKAQWLAQDEAQTPFDLAAGPLIRARLVRLGEQEHIVLLTVHHIASDGWSTGVLVREIAALYAAFARGEPSPLPELPIQYADFAHWQRRWLSGEVLQQQLDYWRGQLQGAPEVLALPTDRPRLPVQRFRGANHRFTVPAYIVHSLHEVSRQQQATLFMTLAAAFNVLLARYAGQADICIGTPIANRQRAELESLIGFFVNNLVLRTQVDANRPFTELLAQVRAAALEAYAHQDLPFEQLVDALAPTRSMAHQPLFQVLLVLQNVPAERLSLPGLELRPLAGGGGTTKFDISLYLMEREQQLVATLEYDTDLFDAATIARMAAHFTRLLQSVGQAPESPVHALAWLGEEELAALRRWNTTETDYVRGQALQQIFEMQVERTSEAVALVFEDTELTYAELNARANRLAHHLRGLGVGPDVLVAVCAERSAVMVVALLATLKAGGAYVPLDPSYPSERLGFMLADARPKVLLTQQALLGSLPVSEGLATFCLDLQWDSLPARDTNPPCTTLPAHLAYVIYTSGSTGKPKGVGVTHASVGNFLHSMAKAPGLSSEDVLLAVTSLSFDIAGLELWLPLTRGARCVLASREATADGRQLRSLIERCGVTVMQATPSSWRMLLEAGWPEAGLRVLCGGEALPSDLAAQLLEHTGQVWNLYGPTETTIWSALQCVRDAQRITIGQPIANTQVHILDDAFNLVPQGVPGELFIAGDGLARGYVNRPELTAERFVPNPFGVPGSRMYRTGDLARWLSDGSIDYLGRIDQQVKIRGFRIEPGEIEAVLAAQPEIREAVVLAREDVPGDKRLVAYVVPSETRASAQLGLSLFYFGADTYAEQDKYRLYLQAARFADDNGLQAIWTPERHFDPVGALYPNPAILNAALAASTRRVQLRAGSVVLPLQDPIRVAEEWAVVDNLSAGRVGLAIASGWHLRDFVLAPHQFEQRRQAMQDGIAQLQALWRGETIERIDGAGNTTSVRTYPRPLQPELPLWITAAGNPQTFAYAGQIGANVLTHLLGQTIEQVADNIALYRRALVEHGHDPQTRQVTLMVHTFMGEDQEATIEQARLPFMAYMRAHVGLQMPLLQSLGIPVEQATPEKIEMVVQFAFERYSRTAALIGTPESCAPLVAAIARAGVTEIACLIDWMDADSALDALEHLPRLREQAAIPALDAQALRSRCEQVLPHYMVPAHFVVLDALPLTPNGKIDRKALPAPQLQLAQSGYTAPSTPTEQTLARIWEQVLRLDKVGVQDHFFTLGGHSLMAVQLVSKIGAAFGVELPLRMLFEAPTVRQLAQRVEAAQQQGQQTLSPPIGRVNREQPLALSFAQQRLWFIDQLEPGSSFYNTPTAVRLVGELDVQALDKTLNEVVRRHEVLRTSFQMVEGSPVQVIAGELALQLPVTDLGALPEGEREAKAQWLAQDEAQTPFDLATGPLIRARLLKLQPAEHIVLLTVHHIISDGWSAGVLVHEIAALYAAFTQGQPSPLPELAIQYADFAHWQRQWLSGDVLEQQLAYWRGQLQGAPEVLALPTDRPRPPVQRFRGATHHFTVPAEITQGLHTVGQQEQATLFMTLAAAFNVLLARYSGQSDICIGAPIANRQRPELEPLIGFFVNTLILRTQVDAEASFADLLRQVRATALGAYAHQDLPFEQLVDALAPARSMAHQPLFQVVLALQNPPTERLTLPGLELKPLAASGSTTKFDLSLSVLELGQQLAATLEYDTDLFDADTIERMAGHFVRLLQSVIQAPATPIHRLAWLADEEQAQLRSWSAIEADYPSDRSLHELFEQQVDAAPQAIAVTFEEDALTYAQLNARANRLAHHLRNLGVGPDVLVAVCAERSLDMVVALLAVLKAGGAYVPLDPAYPTERIAYMLSDARPAVLLTQQALLAQLPAHQGIPVVCIDSQWNELPVRDGNLPCTGLPGHLAYVIYTSGSTGKPKGAALAHHNVLRLFAASRRHFGFGPGDVWTMFHSFAFDFSVWELWGALLHGGRLVVVPYLVSRAPERFYELLVREGVTVLNQTPSAFQQLVEVQRDRPSGALALRTVIFGGEALNVAALQPWWQQHGDRRPQLVNMYGITETTVHVTHCALDAGARAGDVGRPLADLGVHILDAQLNPLPAGVPGQLYVAGAGLARGYLRRPALTAERFVPNPYGAPGSRLYATGDLARWLPDGSIEHLGRIDQQVKIRGFRIELGEIEATLRQQPAVRDAAVVAREDASGHRQLIAYVVAPDPAQPPDGDALREALSQSLPGYMVPAHFVALPALPLTPNGKLDHKALPAPGTDLSADTYVAPGSAAEHALAAVWADVLRLPRVGIHDNFFRIGGDSILSLRIVSRAREQGLSFAVVDLFKHQTVAQLAQVLARPDSSVHGTLAPQALPPFALLSEADRAQLPADIEDAYPATLLQLGMIFHNEHAQGSATAGLYHDVFSYHVQVPAWNEDAFRTVLQALAGRHPALRTAFALNRFSQPLQLVQARGAVPLACIDVRGQEPAEQERDIARFIEQERRSGFALDAAPLLRVFVHLRAPQSIQYTLSFHHAVLDGWSVASFNTELSLEYGKLLASGAATLELPLLAAAPNLVAAAERQALESPHHRAFWQRYLANYSYAQLPPYDGQPRAASVDNRVGGALAAGTVTRLRELAVRLNVPLRSVLLLAHLRVVAMLSGKQDVLVGLVSNVRPELPDGERMLGLFLNTLPFRQRLPRASWADAIRATFRTELALIEHRFYPYAQLHRDNGRTPFYEIAFNYNHFHVYEEADDAGAIQLRGGQGFEATDMGLFVNIADSTDALVVELRFDTEHLSLRQAEQMFGLHVAALEAIAADPDAPHDSCDLVPQHEHGLLREWNATQVSYPREQALQQLFEAQAGRTPESVALVFGDTELTYAELNARANRLAHHLRGLGVGPDVLVAVCAERSVEMVVALLGTLKAGGAYVPLDPSYPPERLGFMLADAQPRVLLTQQALLGSLPVAEGLATFCLDSQWEALLECDSNLPCATLAAHLAYVIYTSGSTGRPKGVGVTHASVGNFLHSMAKAPGLGSEDVLLAVTSLSFDIAGLELWLPLTQGARCVLASREATADGRQLRSLIERCGVTVMQATPSSWRMLLEAGWPEAGLRVLCGGEALPSDLAAQLLEHTGQVWNLYGPTETTIWSALQRVQDVQRITIGQPIANTQVHILDEAFNLVPQGVPGELYIAGDGLARGYVNRPELTAERFVPNPFGVPGSRMYRTGDLSRWLADGSIDYLGRIDQQVKIRGFRIEPGEIESVLAAQPEVREAVVLAREDAPGDKRLVAYVVPSEARASAQLGLSLFYFGADTYAEQDKYRLYLQAARFADDNGLQAIWTPERHFDPVGALYPNPAILNAALAASTRRVQLRAGSVVLPLQDPIRVAEEWAVVDNLSAGRIGLAIASGWHLRDFVLAPHQFEQRRQAMQDGIAQLQALWRGEAIERIDGAGNLTSVRTYPRPLQPELPLWITAAGNPQTFAYAGQIGANVLTHLLGQTIEQVAANVDLYRKSLVEHGHDPLSRQVTLMVHTFMGEDQEATIEQARLPFMAYMRAHVGLQMPLLQSLGIPVEQATPDKIEMVVQFAFERYSRTAALIGTPESCAPLMAAIAKAGVTEIACLIDWMDADSALNALEHLPQLREQAVAPALETNALRIRCEQALPHYMVPAHFVVLDALPLTPNGKIDRKALPAPQLQLAQSGYAAPSTPTENTLARIWEQVLRLERVGVHDNLFQLGGHSLLAVQLVSRMRAVFGVELPLRVLFEAPTIAQLAQRLQQAQQAALPPIGRVSRDQLLALSFAQQRLWFIDQLEPGSSFYNIPAAVRLVGRLDVAALQRTLNEVVRRHEVLRTSFQVVEGSPVQVIAGELALELPVTDLAELPAGEREARAQWLAQDEAQTPFDLATGPLIRARLLKLGAQEHIVLLTVHHIASDGWSAGVLVREVAALYGAFVNGAPSPLPELAVQYADYAQWQREWLSGEVLQQQLDYWRGQLQGAPEVLALPTDKPRPSVQRFRGSMHRFMVPADITAGLQAVGRQEQATLFMTLAAAFNLLLARYAGQDDICIGTPIANRQRAELEPMIGFFVNTLILRTRVDAGASFNALLRQVRATALGAYAHQDLPFEQLVDTLAPARSMAHQPLFQVLLVLQNVPAERLSLPGLELRPLAAGGSTTKFDLSLAVMEAGEQLAAALEYDTDLFDADTIERMAGHFVRLLQAVVRAPEAPVHRLAWLAEDELAQLRKWNATDTEYPREQVLHGLFEAQVPRTPDAVALAFEGTELTYAELNARANRLAHHLRELGVGPDVLVAVCAERSLAMVVALMAVLKAGGAYVPLDPGYPSERLAFMLADARPAVLLTQEALLASLPAREAPIFCLDSQWYSLPARDTNPPCTTLPAHLAYVIYTSGSTGRPKAAGVSHTAIVNRLQWMQQAYGLDSSDRVLQKTPFSFDVSVWEFFWPLQQGATLVLARPGGHQDAQYLGELIASAGITTLHFVPPMLEAFLATSRVQPLPALRQVMCSGQALPWELQQRFFERLPQVQLHNLYGPTEAAVDVTAWHCTPEGPQGVVPIGRPIFNIRIHIVDAQFNLLPQGVPGELCIAGVGLARGYIGRAELTAERFVPDPFGAPGERMYRTGDLARWLPDGSIEYLGRIDQQVKIRGFRIELGEIEAQLAAQAGVREAVVLAREDIPGDTRLVAYVVPQADSELEATALRTQLQRQLPDYMVPAHFVVLEALPLTPNGKLDRKALPAPETDQSAQYTPPRTPIEMTMASVWSEVLHVGNVGVHDNFFELGGHSLLIVRLVDRLAEHGLHIDV